MTNIIQQLEAEQMKQDIPAFRSGDSVAIQVKVKEGERERLQTFEGVVIAKRNRGLNSAFTVRKISSGEGVERTFQTHSPMIASIKVTRRGDVHQGKLYYLRELSGRAARIKERIVRKAKPEAKKPAAKKAAPKKAEAAEKPEAKKAAPKKAAAKKPAAKKATAKKDEDKA